jgi:hypothetical protein
MADLTGTTDADTLLLTGPDHIFAFEGDDTIVFDNPNGSTAWGSSIDGGDGYDIVDASQVTSNLRLTDIGQFAPQIPLVNVTNVEHLIGGSGNDVMVMLLNTSGVTLEGEAGNDILIGGSGADRLLGGSGIDFSLYISGFRHAAITLSQGSGIITQSGGATDMVDSIEYTIFLDGTLTTDENSAAAQASRLYEGLFGRGITAQELDNTVHAFGHGASLTGVAGDLARGSDALGIISEASNDAFVDRLYSSILGRAADAGGHDFWSGLLSSGVSRDAVIVNFTESAEFRASTADTVGAGLFVTDEIAQLVAALYDTMSDRRPDQDGFLFWVQTLKTGAATLDQVAEAFANSAEFHAATDGMSNAQLVDYLSLTSYGSTLDVNAKAGFVSSLDQGASVGSLLHDFAISAQHLSAISADVFGGIAF